MTASLLKTAGALALFVALGIGGAQAQQNGATRQIVVERAEAAQGSAEAARPQDAASVQASPAPEATAEAPAAEPQAAEATAAVPARAAPVPVAKLVVKAVAKEPRPALRYAGYARRNCH